MDIFIYLLGSVSDLNLQIRPEFDSVPIQCGNVNFGSVPIQCRNRSQKQFGSVPIQLRAFSKISSDSVPKQIRMPMPTAAKQHHRQGVGMCMPRFLAI